ncbi:MAG TPA: RNA 2',3'-cyclic phosphodiesterase [Allosphingosinicella sp.]|uniref:RNA 2',3'-cyclic phosphodiesterase n=1 Tax=Allosphingosinicella sp. TaxID=2823234 RepID=UPI002ED93B05
MHRLFVAIRPPHAIRRQLLDLMGGISGARWQTDEQLHITLRFIGEVDGNLAEDVAAALASLHQASFDTALSGVGAFSRRGQAEVVWAGLAPHEPLKALHKKIDQACVRVGLEPERRAYHPHITLARLKRGAVGPVDAFLESAGGMSSSPFRVDSFGLFESTLTPAGAVYSMVRRYPLA